MIRLLRTVATTLLLGLGLAAGAAAQVPPRPPVRDTLAVRDTVPRDTLPADTVGKEAQDSARPPARFSAIFGPARTGPGRTDFHWDREALLREGAVTLADLLDLVPGVISIRAGHFAQPEAVTAFGQTRGRIEVVLDGYVLDPFTTATFDLAELELAQMSELRVERRLDVTRIHIATLEPGEAQPYSRIEAGTGEPNGNFFRAVFTAPYVIRGPLALALDRIDTDGNNGEEQADLFTLWGKWGWFNDTGSRGLQLEFRQARLRRTEGVPWIADLARSDVILRARQRFAEGIAAELFAGRSSIAESEPDSVRADSLETRQLERDSWQYGARALLRRGPAWLDATLRLRSGAALPGTQADVSGGVDISVLHVGGSVTSASWADGPGALSWDLRAEAGPFLGLGAFAELSGGERGAPLYRDSLGTSTLETHTLNERSGRRLGLSTSLFGADVSAAMVQLETTESQTFGLPFDSVFEPTRTLAAKGLEVFGRVPLWPAVGLSVTGSFNYWDDVGGMLYLPARGWRVAGEVHTLPLPSRNLEIFARLEHQRREAMLIRNPDGPPAPDPEDPATAYLTTPTRNLLNGYLQIRIIDVRAFIHWYDLLGKGREDVPGQVTRGPRILYGVKWQLFN